MQKTKCSYVPSKQYTEKKEKYKKYKMFLRLCLFCTNFELKKPPECHHRCLAEVWHKSNILLLLQIHVKVFDKIIN